VFSELLAAKRDLLEAGQTIIIEVDAQSGGSGGGGGKPAEGAPELRFIARNAEPLAEAASRAVRGIRIKLYEASPLPDIQKLLATAPKETRQGRGQVTLHLDLDGAEEAEFELPGAWQLTDVLKNNLRQLGGGLEVEEC
jgi:hypothetical protein